MTHTLFGLQIALNPFPRTEMKETRILGGYKNRWLVRAFVPVPVREMIFDQVNNRVYCDPQSLREILLEAGKP